MSAVAVHWVLREKIYENHVSISEHKLFSEWTLRWFWSNDNETRPEAIKICRKSCKEEIRLSGDLELSIRNPIGELKRMAKFKQVLYEGFKSTTIDFGDFPLSFNYGFNLTTYEIRGYLLLAKSTIGADNVDTGRDQPEPLAELSANLECLINTEAPFLSDVVFKCGMASFPVHKNILYARSPVFAAMFTTEMKENQDNTVNIEDISPQILKVMLTYIYTGKTGELSVESAGELLFAADKYELLGLKRICRVFLKSHMTPENVMNSLYLGYLHDEDLKRDAVEYICNKCQKFEAIEKTDDWKAFCEKKPNLAIEVLTSLVKSKEKIIEKQN